MTYRWMASCLAMGLVLGAGQGALAQDTGSEGASPAPTPAPAPRLAPPPIRTVAAPVSFTAAPAPLEGSAAPLPVEKKALRKWQAEKRGKIPACFNRGELKPWMGKTMLEACDWLLAQPAMEDDPWDWRARLLQYRAIALINLGDREQAQAAIDESDRIGRTQLDPLFDLSIGIGNGLLHAYLADKRGDSAAARSLLQVMRDRRPYAPSVAKAADRFEMTIDPALPQVTELLAQRERLDPDINRTLLMLYLIGGEYENAANVGDKVSLVDPKLRGGWTLRGDNQWSELRKSLAFDGVKAYVAAAAGRNARAAELLAEGRQEIADYVGENPGEADPTRRFNKAQVKRYQERAAEGAKLTKLVDEWQQMIDLRPQAETIGFKELTETVGKLDSRAELFPATMDLLNLRAKDTESADGKAAAAISKLLLNQTFLGELTLKPGEIAAALPRFETLDQVPKFASTASKWLFSDGSGYSQSKEGDGDIRTVRYESEVGSAGMVEEMMLMAVATYAQKEGKDGFVILSNRTFPRVITTYGQWGGNSTRDAGFEAQARVLLVEVGNLPPQVQGQEDRVISNAEIEERVKPRYDGYLARQEAIKAAEKAAKR